jgi:uncharacterized protein (DUF1330 family)
MTAYVIAEIDVTDRDAYRAYEAADADSVKRHGGRFLVKGGPATGFEGASPKRLMVVEFADLASAHRWYNSPENRDARTIRAVAAKSRMFAVEGM